MPDLNSKTIVASWIVLDDPNTATEFPSVGGNSATAGFQRVYWQCLVVFFFTARVHNPSLALVLYANVDAAVTAPADMLATMQALGVVFRRLDITFRLPFGSVGRWGNQFYVLDIIRDFAANGGGDALVLVDSDCVWRGPVDGIDAALRQHECLLYTLSPADQKEYEGGRLMNGMSLARMSEIARAEFDLEPDRQVQYHGGEFFAATRSFCQRIQQKIPALWRRAQAEAMLPDAIKEEAHFLSILAEGMAVTPGTGNTFVRRIWTNFEDLNAARSDELLTLWHLPAEKRFGFRRLWRHLKASQCNWRSLTPDEINRLTSRYMGIPWRTSGKLILDITEKLLARVARAD